MMIDIVALFSLSFNIFPNIALQVVYVQVFVVLQELFGTIKKKSELVTLFLIFTGQFKHYLSSTQS